MQTVPVRVPSLEKFMKIMIKLDYVGIMDAANF
jgi:hypothetical protein